MAKQENKKLLEKERLEKQEEQESGVEKVVEPQTSETVVGFSHGSGFADNALHHGLSHDGDRMEFQVHGHDGPKTYKWGYDTGKG